MKAITIFKSITASLLIFAGLCCAPSVLAQFSGYYGEGFYGSGTTEFEFFTDLSDFDGDSDFFGLTVGRTFNDNLAAEISYIELGESDAVISNPAIATLNAQIESRAIAFTAVGTYPINRYFTAFGKLGFNQWKLDASVVDTRFGSTLTLSGDDRGTGINYGLGMQYRLTPSYALKLEYLVYQLNPELFADDVVTGGLTIALRFNY